MRTSSDESTHCKLRRIYENEDDFFQYFVIKFREVDKKKQAKIECLVSSRFPILLCCALVR